MAFRIKISELAVKNFEKYLGYVSFDLENAQASVAIYEDFLKTLNRLSNTASSFAILDNCELARYGYRKIHFSKHKVIVIYRIENGVVYVDGIYHTSQDYENLFQARLRDSQKD